jgi:hypothetical protein
VEVSPGDLPPAELRCGALIEVWAPDDGSHFTASRRGIDTPAAGGLRVWVWLRSAAGLAASRPRRGRAIS